MLPYRNSNLKNIELCNFLLDLGFTNEEVIKIVFDPSFFVTYYDKVDIMVKNGYQYLIEKKFEKEKIKKIILRYPGILTFSSDKKNRVENYFNGLGISNIEFRNMIYRCPNLYGYTVDRIKKHFDFFNNIGLHDELCHNPKSFFMQSIESSYARYMFYRDMHVEINKDTYRRLFYGWTWFKKTYDVTRDCLLEMYNYNNIDSNDREVK